MEVKNDKSTAFYLNFGKNETDFFSNYFSKVRFPKTIEFFYEGQVPNVAIYLLKGQICLERYQRVVEYVHEGAVIGVRELILNKVSKVKAILEGGSEIFILDKTTLRELFSTPDEILRKFKIQ